jgi:hypothetical protein
MGDMTGRRGSDLSHPPDTIIIDYRLWLVIGEVDSTVYIVHILFLILLSYILNNDVLILFKYSFYNNFGQVRRI